MTQDSPAPIADKQPHPWRGHAAANTTIAAVGTAAAVGAVTGLILPALVGAAIGGAIAYVTSPQQPVADRR